MDTNELSIGLRTAISAMHKSLRKQFYSAVTYSMTEIETIAHLARTDALMPTELAALTRVKTQSMSQILKKLEQDGIIRRSPSKNDLRKVYISLTAAGKKMVDKTRDDRSGRIKNVIESALTDKERKQLAKSLPVLNKILAAL